MEVARLIVLVLSATGQAQDIQEDDRRDGYALAVKFLSQRKANIEQGWEAVANGAALDVAGHGAAQIGKHSALVVHCLDGKLRTPLEDIAAFLKEAKTCGVYILMHGIHGMVTPNDAAGGCLSPKSVAKLINTLCPRKTINLSKVNIVGCTLARKPDGQQGKQKARKQITKAGSWAQAFCDELERSDTMVAAYTEAVYVVRDNNPEFKTFGVDESLRPQGSKLGQKSVTLGEDIKMETVAAHRTKVKKVFQYHGGKVVDVGLDQYKTWGT